MKKGEGREAFTFNDLAISYDISATYEIMISANFNLYDIGCVFVKGNEEMHAFRIFSH